MDQIRVGIIGCGGISRRHFGALEAMREVKIVAVCDMQQARAEEKASQTGAVAYTDYRQMLKKERLDAAYVLTPTFARGSQVRDIVKRGINVFAEKPVAVSMAQARRDLKAVEESGVIASVGFIIRYTNASAKIKQFLADRQVTLASAWYLCPLPPMPWWPNQDFSGGQTLDQSIHMLDLFRYFVGEVDTVSACYSREAFKNRKEISIADSGATALRFANGAVGTLASSCCLNAPAPTPGLTLSGEDFHIEFTYKKLKIATAEETIEESVDLNDGYVEESRAFIEAVATGQPDDILCSYRDGVKSVALALAINKSAETCKTVKVGSVLGG